MVGVLGARLRELIICSTNKSDAYPRTLGREGTFLHVQCVRVASELVVLADRDSRYDWLLPAVQKRMREELVNLQYDLATVETQAVDLLRGGQLHFLGFELRLASEKRGDPRVRYQLLEEASLHQNESALPSRRLLWCYQPLQFVARYLERRRGRQLAPDTDDEAEPIKVGWRRLPLVLLYFVFTLLFGWCWPGLRRRLQGDGRILELAHRCLDWLERQRGWRLMRDPYRKVQSIQVGWRQTSGCGCAATQGRSVRGRWTAWATRSRRCF